MSVTMYVGAMDMLKGIEYSGVIPNGNAFQVTEDIRISINRTPFAMFKFGDKVYANSLFTYSFEDNTTILLTRETQADLSIIWNKQCPFDVTLNQNTESADICSVTALEDITTGKVTALANILNANNQDADVIFRLKIDGVEIHQETFTIPSNMTLQKATEVSISTPITANQVASFTLEADDDMTVKGVESASQIQVTRYT